MTDTRQIISGEAEHIISILHLVQNYGQQTYHYFISRYLKSHNVTIKYNPCYGYLWHNIKTNKNSIILKNNVTLLNHAYSKFVDDEMSGKVPYLPEFLLTGHLKFNHINR